MSAPPSAVIGSTAPTSHRVQANGLSIAYYEWNAARRGHGPTLLFAHATGFHARVWDAAIARLPADWHVVAADCRGHGATERTPIAGWEQFGRDAAAFVAALDLRDIVGVGHSKGASALVQAAAFEPTRFTRLLLLDPTILSPQVYHRPSPFPDGEHPVTRRANHFASAQAMIERFVQRPPYSLFDPQVLHDYCTYGLRPADDGNGYELACAPITEASVYLSSRNNLGIYASIRALEIPVLVVRGREPTDPKKTSLEQMASPTWPGLAAEFRHGRQIHLADRGHLFPLESPELVATLVREFVAQA